MLRDFFYLGGIILGLEYKYGIKIPIEVVVPVVVVLALIFEYFIGEWDERKGFWKTQNSIQNRELTPFFSDLSDDIKSIKEKLDK